MSQLILQPIRCFTYVTAHSPSSFSNLSVASTTSHSFSNPSVALPTSQLNLQPFRCFTNVTAHSPHLPLLHQRHNSFSNPSVALPTPQFILQPFRCFTYVTVHSPTLPLLYLCHSSFSNPSVASPTSQFVLQPFFRFSYVTSSSLNSPGEPPCPLVTFVGIFSFFHTFFHKLHSSFLAYRAQPSATACNTGSGVAQRVAL